ncbi:hypothetical protein [Winogradskyella sp.]|uniref:hypothetical protein n=1 Tax=Winogradskyella sp. TaxID=1883156 RepID=UPI003BA897C2
MKYLLYIIFTFYLSSVFCQDSIELSILSADDNWSKEIITFPVDWAPNLTLKGFEELRFSPFWSNPKSTQFWSLVMAWKVNATSTLTIEALEDNFEAYFDGLMKPNHWATTFPQPTVVFLPNPEKDSANGIIGKMRLFDGFHTGKSITLNIKVEQYFCETIDKAIIIFRLSPKDFEHSIWNELNAIIRTPRSCE